MTRPKIIDGKRAFFVEALAFRWKISQSTVKRYLRSGKLPGKKIYHGSWHVSAAVVLKFELRYGFGPAPLDVRPDAQEISTADVGMPLSRAGLQRYLKTLSSAELLELTTSISSTGGDEDADDEDELLTGDAIDIPRKAVGNPHTYTEPPTYSEPETKKGTRRVRATKKCSGYGVF